MFSVLPTKVKLGIGLGLLLIILVVGGIITYQSNRIDSLKKELTTCEVNRQNEKALYDEERQKAKDAIEKQNSSINIFQLDKTSYEKTVYTRDKQNQEAGFVQREAINKELTKDSTADNQLRIITRQLKDFAK